MSSDLTNNPYWKLRPFPPTPAEDICHCADCRRVMLCDTLTENPLQCFDCRGEVAPERIGFDELLADGIAHWRGVHRSLYLLWLDSDEYETWASERLVDPNGRVNVLGREIVSGLNQFVRAYLSWFHDSELDNSPTPTTCPICELEMEPVEGCSYFKCESCSVLM